MPDPIPSRQTVTFVLHNGSSSPISVLVEGYLCSAFAIYRVSGDGTTLVNREVDFTFAECSCCMDDSEVGTYQLVDPSATLELTWDAREEQVVERTVACPDDSEYEYGQIEVPLGVPRPVEPGRYEVEISVGLSSASGDLPPVFDGRFECVGDFTYDTVGRVCAVGCGSSRRVPFDVPASGDVTVTVELAQ